MLKGGHSGKEGGMDKGQRCGGGSGGGCCMHLTVWPSGTRLGAVGTERWACASPGVPGALRSLGSRVDF